MSETQEIIVRGDDLGVTVRAQVATYRRRMQEIVDLKPPEVTTEAQKNDAVDAASMMKALAKEIETQRKATVGPLNVLTRFVNDAVKPILTDLKAETVGLEKAVARWAEAEARRQREEREREKREAEEKAAKAREQAEAARKAAEAASTDQQREAALRAADEAEARAVDAENPIVLKGRETVSLGSGSATVATVETVEVKVEKADAMALWLLENRGHGGHLRFTEVFSMNPAAIKRWVNQRRRHGLSYEIPGVRVKISKSVQVRS